MTDKTRLFQPLFPQSLHAEAWWKHPTVRAFNAKFAERAPSLQDLIKLGKHTTSPSLKLSEEARTALVMALSPRCISQTRDDLSFKLQRSLGLLPHFWWAGNIGLDVDKHGAVKILLKEGTDQKDKLKEMRTCILRS